MATLGSLRHTARIDEAATGRPLWYSTEQNLHHVDWERQYCEVSVASLTISAPPHVRDRLEPWKYLLSIYANDELVWYGPILRVKATRSSVEILARDPGEWWRRRRVAQARSYRNRDASQVARDLVTDAMGRNDPCRVVAYLRAESSGVWVTKEITPAVRYVSDEINDLDNVGLTWTFAAGRLLLGPIPAKLTLNTLQDSDWDAEIAVVKDGTEVVTDLLVQGSGVYGYYIDAEEEVGWLQGIEKADSLVRQEECEELGRRRVEEAKYPPRRIEVGGDSRLLPSAPVRINDLVPGVLVPISSSQTGVTVSSVMSLRSVSVTEDDKGDMVQITLMERPSALDPLLVPPLVEEDYNSPYDKDRRAKEQQMPRNDSTGGGNDLTTSTPPPAV